MVAGQTDKAEDRVAHSEQKHRPDDRTIMKTVVGRDDIRFEVG
jgi:hypothetical protein